MRRKKFVSKKLAVILLSVSMVLSPMLGVVAAPVNVYAAEQSADNEVEEAVEAIAEEGSEETSEEAAETPALENSSEKDPEAVSEPSSEDVSEDTQEASPAVSTSGYIENNEERINTNYSTIGVNNGLILDNRGLVYENKAEIINNNDNGVITDNNNKIISNNGVVSNNYYEITDNNGTVLGNRNTIVNSNGYVKTNDKNAKITENNGHVLCNSGDVDNNSFIVQNNDNYVNNNSHLIINNNGHVETNSGNIVNNYGKTYIVEEGAVQNNYTGGIAYGSSLNPDDERVSNVVIAQNRGGTVVSGVKPGDLLTIRNYYYGDLQNVAKTPGKEVTCNGKIKITNKFGEKGDTDKDFVTVENQYNSIEVYDADNTDVTFEGFVRDDVDYTQYIQTAKNGEPVEITGTITLKAKEGYSLSDNGKLSGSVDKLVYGLSKNEDGSYTVSISSLTGDVAISPEMINLIVSEISDDKGEVKDVVVENGEASENIEISDVGGDGPGAEDNAVAKGNLPNNQKGVRMDKVADGEVMDINLGYVDRNDGTINNNADNSAIVQNNYGTINSNNAIVPFNFGKINDNNALVFNPTGTVVNNNAGGQVIGGRNGYDADGEGNGDNHVINNLGGEVYSGRMPDNNCVITNFYSGEIKEYDELNPEQKTDDPLGHGTICVKNSYSDEDFTERDYLTVEKQFHSVEIKDAENIDVSYSGFDQSDVDNKWYTQTKANSEPVEIKGTITLKAKDGYKLSDDGQHIGQTDKVTYSISKNEDGSYTVGIYSLAGNVSLTPQMLHLKVTEAKNECEEGKVGDNSANGVSTGAQSDTISVPGAENSGSGMVYGIGDGPRVYVPYTTKTVAPRGGSDAHSYKIVEFDFGDNINLTAQVVKTLCEGPQLAKRCLFNYEGKQYVMNVPVVDTTSSEYTKAIGELKKEYSQAAGFMRITKMFENVGFTVSEVAQ